jgi:putative transposase
MAMSAMPSPALFVVPPLHRALRSEQAPDPLRDQLAAVVERSALAMLDPAVIESQAEDMRLIERHRVHHAGLLIDALVLSALQRSTDTQGRWLDAQRTYESIGGARSGKTSFRNNVRKLVPLMNRMLRRRLKALAERTADTELRGRLMHFADVLVPDGCAFKVAAALSGVYAGTGTDAELKLHAVHSVRAGGAMSVEPSAGRVHDSDGFWPERWEKDALYLWDLGFESKERFIDATLAGAHVLQRLKSSSNPVVLASYGPTAHGLAVEDDLGRALRINDACASGVVHKQRVLDLDVRIDDANGRSAVARVVCVPFGGEDRYYLTTLPRAVFTPHDVAELYRVRWEVERMFRGWRGALRLDEVIRLSHPKSIIAAVTASLLAATLAQDITRELNALEEEEASVAIPP